jgi:hypothetical protein
MDSGGWHQLYLTYLLSFTWLLDTYTDVYGTFRTNNSRPIPIRFLLWYIQRHNIFLRLLTFYSKE